MNIEIKELYQKLSGHTCPDGQSMVPSIWKDDKRKHFPHTTLVPYSNKQMTISIEDAKVRDTGYYFCHGQKNNVDFRLPHVIIVAGSKVPCFVFLVFHLIICHLPR